MAQLPKGHPLHTVYRHLVNYGQQELANDVANFGVMAQHNAEQLWLLQRYVLDLKSETLPTLTKHIGRRHWNNEPRLMA